MILYEETRWNKSCSHDVQKVRSSLCYKLSRQVLIRIFICDLECIWQVVNLDKVLVNVHVGKKMYVRRGVWKYFKSEAKL